MAKKKAGNSTFLVTIIGGSGFLGRHIVAALVARGHRVRVGVRHPERADDVVALGGDGQVEAVQANILDQVSLDNAIDGSDGVINLVGILYESGQQTFDAIQAEGPRRVARAANKTGARRLVQMSAIGADAQGDAAYARTKAQGEANAFAEFSETIILRPSIVFGPEDNFFNQFANMSRIAPALPLIGGGHTRFQPVYVGDIAEATARAMDGDLKPGTIYELGGPDIESFKQLLQRMLDVIGRKRLLAPIPMPIARIQAMVLGALPKPLLTKDQLKLLQRDNVVSRAAIDEGRTLQGIGIEPTSMADILPTYLNRFRKSA